eukprot:364569-Chlamydomonas_euryale.AAC.23
METHELPQMYASTRIILMRLLVACTLPRAGVHVAMQPARHMPRARRKTGDVYGGAATCSMRRRLLVQLWTVHIALGETASVAPRDIHHSLLNQRPQCLAAACTSLLTALTTTPCLTSRKYIPYTIHAPRQKDIAQAIQYVRETRSTHAAGHGAHARPMHRGNTSVDTPCT